MRRRSGRRVTVSIIRGMSEYASGRAERCLFSFRPPEPLGSAFPRVSHTG